MRFLRLRFCRKRSYFRGLHIVITNRLNFSSDFIFSQGWSFSSLGGGLSSLCPPPPCLRHCIDPLHRPWAVNQNDFSSWHPSGEHLVYGLFERYIGILLPKKVPKQKTCQMLRKRVICDYLLLKCITAKKFEILNSTITKTTCIMRESTKNYI